MPVMAVVLLRLVSPNTRCTCSNASSSSSASVVATASMMAGGSDRKLTFTFNDKSCGGTNCCFSAFSAAFLGSAVTRGSILFKVSDW